MSHARRLALISDSEKLRMLAQFCHGRRKNGPGGVERCTCWMTSIMREGEEEEEERSIDSVQQLLVAMIWGWV